MPDIADEEEYARALAATSHVRGPDLTKAGRPRVEEHDDDDDLQRAIAMSLQEVQGAAGDDELERVLLESAKAAPEVIEISDTDSDELPPPPPKKRARLTSPPKQPTLAMDRKAMEAERLERQRKLKGDNLFWQGEVRPTFNKLAPSDKSFALRELVGDSPKLIVAAGFVWDLEWLAGIFPDPQFVPTLLIMHPNTDADNGSHGRVSSGGLSGAVVQHAFMPKAPGAAMASGTQHMKFMLVSRSSLPER